MSKLWAEYLVQIVILLLHTTPVRDQREVTEGRGGERSNTRLDTGNLIHEKQHERKTAAIANQPTDYFDALLTKLTDRLQINVAIWC